MDPTNVNFSAGTSAASTMSNTNTEIAKTAPYASLSSSTLHSLPPTASIPPGSQNKPQRELKVEDALLYLDQVKVEFSEKPHIYNEFLDIMKNFKSQSINTPGVIEKVKNLFKGYNKLILGFNTFLPEGEGYKIELTPEDEASSVEATPSLATNNPSVGHGVPAPPAALAGPTNAAPAPLLPSAVNGVVTNASVVPLAPASAVAGPATTPAGVPGNAANGAPTGHAQQAHAIHYVTKIRNRFSQEPETYRHFLKILHNYQKEQKGIKEVLEQVSQLFADHPDLLVEFTYFLPDAVQEQAKERLEKAAKESHERKANSNAKSAKIKNKTQQSASVGMMSQAAPGYQQFMTVPGVAAPVPIGLPTGADLSLALAGQKRARVDGKLFPAAQGYPLYAPSAMGLHMNSAALDDASALPANKKQATMFQQQQQQLFLQQQQLQQQLQQQAYQQQFASGAALGLTGLLPANPSVGALAVGTGKKQNRRKSAPAMANGGPNDAQMSLLQAQQQALQSQPPQQRRDAHMSVSAERRFFDTVKDALLSQSRDAWTDFIKCLDMFANDALSKDELLEMLSDVLGPARADMLHEFRRLLENRADYQEHKEDLWYSVPLSEIDYTQCRKCTPSYRALPRDYPKPKCSDRNQEEEKVLNDVWVSIPIGSEESYSFKHMRKNQFEEALFRCEDERFEVDMLIDTNTSTIRALEPLAEEIAQLKLLVGKRDKDGHDVNPVPRFALQLEKRQFSTVHLNSIQRIYGDHGEEILELLRKNPAGAIPVILKRLRQKDVEWRRAREQLNKSWKETIEKNFYKSFDHRSFYFRQHDKKFLHTKQLVAELTTFAQSSDDTHDAQHSGMRHANSSAYRSDFAGIQPSMCLAYEHDAHFLHRAIFKLVCHAVEQTSSLSLSDRERISALWRDLLRVLFSLPLHYLYAPSESDSLRSSNSTGTVKGESYPAGTHVITQFGSGVVRAFREHDSCYEVQLAFGRAFLGVSAILGAEELSCQALQAVGVQIDSATGKSTIFDQPVALTMEEQQQRPSVKPPCELFFGTQLVYIFLRLHHTLYVRLRAAWLLAKERADEQNEREREHPERNDAEHHTASALFAQFFSSIMSLAEGSTDGNKFEDFARSLLGNKSFVVFTLDKIISQLIKHLQAMANDENVNRLVGLFVYHRNQRPRSTPGVDVDLYRNHVAQILAHTAEDVFRFQYLCSSEGINASHSEIAIQQMGVLSAASLTANSSTFVADNNLADQKDDDTQEYEAEKDTVEGEDDADMDMESIDRVPQGLPASPKTPKAVISDDEDESEEEDDEGSQKME